MSDRLTQVDFQILEHYAELGNRYDYWTYLKTKGDPYAGLALGVVTNETMAGYIANNFLESKARAAGVQLDEAALNQIGVMLMQADLVARQKAFDDGKPDGGLQLDVQTIERYHGAVFGKATGGRLGVTAWTAELPLRQAMAEGDATGDYSKANEIWQEMLANPIPTVFDLVGAPPAEAAEWLAIVGTSTADYERYSRDTYSNRNISYIEGWSYDKSTGQWFKPAHYQLFGSPEYPPHADTKSVIYADKATSDHLNQVQALRQAMFGSNAIDDPIEEPPNPEQHTDAPTSLPGEASAPQTQSAPDPAATGGTVRAPARQGDQDPNPAGRSSLPSFQPPAPPSMRPAPATPDQHTDDATGTAAPGTSAAPQMRETSAPLPGHIPAFAAFNPAGTPAGGEGGGDAGAPTAPTAPASPTLVSAPVGGGGSEGTLDELQVRRYAVQALRLLNYQNFSAAQGVLERVEATMGLEGCAAVEAEVYRLRENALQGYERDVGLTGIVPPPPPDNYAPNSPLMQARRAAAERASQPTRGIYEPASPQVGQDQNAEFPRINKHKYGTVTIHADNTVDIWWDDKALIRLIANWIKREQERPSLDGRRFNGRKWPQYVSTYDPYDIWY